MSGSATRVGPYRLLARIGEGGMGVVHLAEDPAGHRVAVKLLRPHVVGDDEGRARMAREVTSLRRVRSPRVAEVYDADPWGDTPYVVTRYVPGLSLHDHIAQHGPIRGDDLTVLAAGLAEALVAVHDGDVLHRDVKPSNVLLEGRNPVLIDFGLAQLADDARITRSGWLLGTPGYLAPEILYGDEPTPAADVHSWAATVVFAATGQGPYGKGPSVAVMDRVRRGEHDLSGVPDALYWTVARALEPDSRERPTAHQLADWLAAPVPRAVPAEPTAQTRVHKVRPSEDRPATGRQQPSRAPAPAAPPSPAAPTTAQSWPTAEPDRPQTQDPDGPAPPPRRRFAAGLFWLCMLALVVAGAVTAPVVTAAAVATGGWLLRVATVRSRAMWRWRSNRGPRRHDGVLATVCLPWFLVVALPASLVNAAVAALDAALVTVVASVALPERSPLLPLALGGLTAGVLTWWGPYGRAVRYGGSRFAATVLRPGAATLLVLLLLLAAAAAVLVLRETGGTSYGPLPAPPWDQYLRDLAPR